MQGQSFEPILQSSDAQGRDAWVYELFRDFPFGGRVAPHKALRTQAYIYIDWDKCRSPELYDLANDPRELINIFDSSRGQAVAPQLQQMLERLKNEYKLVQGRSRSQKFDTGDMNTEDRKSEVRRVIVLKGREFAIRDTDFGLQPSSIQASKRIAIILRLSSSRNPGSR